MNVWVVYVDSGAYSSWFREVCAVFSTHEAAAAYAEKKNAGVKHDHGRGIATICYDEGYEASDEFWVVDALRQEVSA